MPKISPTTKRQPKASPSPASGLVCFAASGVALPEGELPNRVKIAPWGTSQTDTGPVTVNYATAAALKKHNQHPFDTVVFDFAHNTEKKDLPEPKPVAGYGKPEVVPNEGLFLTNMEWTPDGQAAWKGRWYKDVSPTIARNEKGEVIFVKSAALCRNGRIPGAENFDADNEPSYPMKKSLIIQCLNKAGAKLTEDSTDEQIAAAADELSGEGTQQSEVTANMAAEVKKALQEFSAEFKGDLQLLKTNMEKATKTDTASRKQALIDQASREGKVIPFSNEDIMAESFGVDMLEKCIANLKPTVPLKPGTAGAKETPAKTDDFSTEDLAIASMLGVSKENLEKYGNLPDKLGALPA